MTNFGSGPRRSLLSSGGRRGSPVHAVRSLAAALLVVSGGVTSLRAQDGGIEPPPELREGAGEAPDRVDAPRDDRGFPVPSVPADVPDPEVDGNPFPVTGFTLEYFRDHPQHPLIDELRRVPVRLVQTPEGFVAPRAGLPTVTMTIGDLSDGRERIFYASAITSVMRAIVMEFRERTVIGVFVAPDVDQIDLGPGGGRDVRADDDRDLTLVIYTANVTSMRTIASGERIPVDERINNPRHRRIMERSPVRPHDGEDPDDPARRDLLRKDLLDSYAFRLNRHPARRVDIAVAPGEEVGQAELQYLVQEARPWSVYYQLSNTGTESTDIWRHRFGLVHNQLTGSDDILSIEYVTSGFRESHVIIGSYSRPLLGSERVRWRAQGTWSEYTASDVGILDESFFGDGWSVGGDVIWNFFQANEIFVDAFAGVRYQHIRAVNEALGDSGIGEEDLFIPRVGLDLERFTETSSISANLTLEWTHNSVTGASRSGMERLGRLSPDRDWIVLSWGAEYSFYLEPLLNRRAWEDVTTPESSTLAHELALSFRGQHAFGNRLIPNAEAVIGGLYTVRGYPESIVAGDDSMVASAEYRFHVPRVFAIDPEPGTTVFGRPFKFAPQQVYGRPDWDLVLRGFVDVGRTSNSDRLPFERDETLVGTGVGAELLILRNLSLRADWGVALSEVGDGTVTRGSNRFHFAMTVLF